MHLRLIGVDPKTKKHVKNPLTRAESKFLGILWVDHVGRKNKINARYFAILFAREMGEIYFDYRKIEIWKRDVRYMQNHLLVDHNIPVLSKAGNHGGYWIAEDREEAAEFYNTFRKRGLTGLVKASRGKQTAMVDMIKQLSFKFEELVDKTMGPRAREPGGDLAAIQVVDTVLEGMMKDPERFADGLRKIGEKYGGVLIPRTRYDAIVAAMKTKASELQNLAESLNI